MFGRVQIWKHVHDAASRSIDCSRCEGFVREHGEHDEERCRSKVWRARKFKARRAPRLATLFHPLIQTICNKLQYQTTLCARYSWHRLPLRLRVIERLDQTQMTCKALGLFEPRISTCVPHRAVPALASLQAQNSSENSF